MFDTSSDPDDIAEELGFLVSLLDDEGAREAAEAGPARLCSTGLSTAPGAPSPSPRTQFSMWLRMSSTKSMPPPHSEQSSTATVATG